MKLKIKQKNTNDESSEIELESVSTTETALNNFETEVENFKNSLPAELKPEIQSNLTAIQTNISEIKNNLLNQAKNQLTVDEIKEIKNNLINKNQTIDEKNTSIEQELAKINSGSQLWKLLKTINFDYCLLL